MPQYDLPLEKLREYKPEIAKPTDFDAFWKRTLAQAAKHPISARFEPVEQTLYELVNVYDVTFSGFDGQPVRGWLFEPKGNQKKLPCVVTYLGYGGGRSLPPDFLPLSMSGVINLVMDSRGQGTSWGTGDTPDTYTTGPQLSGQFTLGIESAENYYYRRYFTDASRAIDAAIAYPRVDADMIAVQGISQGGGASIVTAGLQRDRVKLCLAEVPGLCHWRRAVEIIGIGPYAEIAKYLATHRDGAPDRVFKTLSYVDGANFADQITATTLISCALCDPVVAPSTIFATYNRIRAPKEIRLFEWNGHEGGQVVRQLETMRTLARWARGEKVIA